jgi:hypothetical protein
MRTANDHHRVGSMVYIVALLWLGSSVVQWAKPGQASAGVTCSRGVSSLGCHVHAAAASEASPPPRRDVRTRSATPLPSVPHDDEGHRDPRTSLEDRAAPEKETNAGSKGNRENGGYGPSKGGVATAIQQPKVQGSLLDVDLIRGYVVLCRAIHLAE